MVCAGLLADEQPESNIVSNVVAAVMVLIKRALVDIPGGALRLCLIIYD